MIRNEVVSVTVNGTNIFPTSISITCGIGKGYNTCNINGISISGVVGDTVIVTINTESISFIIDEKRYGINSRVSFSCKGITAQLDDYESYNNIFTYQDSNSLIVAEVGQIPYLINIPNINFSSKSFTKNSTSLSRIIDAANIVKGEVFEVGGILNISEKKIILASDISVFDFDTNNDFIIDYSYIDKRGMTKKANEVIFNPITDTIYSKPMVTLDVSDNRAIAYFNPSLSQGNKYNILGANSGLARKSLVQETIKVLNESVITLMGGLDSIVSITLNGKSILQSEYFIYPSYSSVRFLNKIIGEIKIEYMTEAIEVYLNKTTDLIIDYMCTRLKENIVVSSKNNGKNGTDLTTSAYESGASFIEIVNPLIYEVDNKAISTIGDNLSILFVEERGSKLESIVTSISIYGGGTLDVRFLYSSSIWNDILFMQSISSKSLIITETTSGTIIFEDVLQKYLIYVDKPIFSINSVYYGNSELTGYAYVDGITVKYIEFLASDFGKSVKISYKTEYVEIIIPKTPAGSPVKYIDLSNSSGIVTAEYESKINSACSLPSIITINIANEFNRTIGDVYGLVLSGNFGNLVVNNLGEITITVTLRGVFNIYCDAIYQGAIVTVDSEGVR